MNAIKIESNIPAPATIRRRKYPFDEMKVGDSFYVSGRRPVEIGGSKLMATKRTGFEFACRTEGDGARVWRVK
jgi:hypothetical protein